MSHLLIDGYNVLAQSSYASRDELLNQIKNYVRGQKHQVTIFFDGTHQGTGMGDRYHEEHIEIIFSPLTITADDMMEEYIENKHHSSMIIVSSDRRIQKAASNKKLTFLESKEFLYKIKYAAPASHGRHTESLPWMEGRTEEDEHRRSQKKGNPQKKSKKDRKKINTMKKL